MFIYIRNMLVNFSLVNSVRKDDGIDDDGVKIYRIIVDFDSGNGWKFNYEVEAERDKAFSDLLKWAGTINPNNMIP